MYMIDIHLLVARLLITALIRWLFAFLSHIVPIVSILQHSGKTSCVTFQYNWSLIDDISVMRTDQIHVADSAQRRQYKNYCNHTH